jgi:hypothetical protein
MSKVAMGASHFLPNSACPEPLPPGYLGVSIYTFLTTYR